VKVNADDVAGLLPWDLVITIGGRDYPTARPTVGMIGSLMKLKDSKTSMDDGLAILGGMFTEPRPDLSACAPEVIAYTMAAYLAYFERQTEASGGKLEAIAARAFSAIAAAG
jgi:hypothetical protein